MPFEILRFFIPGGVFWNHQIKTQTELRCCCRVTELFRLLRFVLSEFSLAKGAKFQTTIHIGNDREEDKIEYLIVSQGKMIMSLVDSQ